MVSEPLLCPQPLLRHQRRGGWGARQADDEAAETLQTLPQSTGDVNDESRVWAAAGELANAESR